MGCRHGMVLLVLSLGLAVSSASRAMLAPPPPATPAKPGAAPLPVTAAKAPQGPAAAGKKPAGRTAAPGGKPQNATGQGARNGIGRFGYMPSDDPVSSTYKSIYTGRRRTLLAPTPTPQQKPSAPPATGAKGRTGKRPETGKLPSKTTGQGARPPLESISAVRPVQESNP